MALKNLSPAGRRELARHLGQRQTQTKWNKYFSRVRFTCTSIVTTGNLNSYVLASGQSVQAFGYSRNQDMAAAGLAGTRATIADTNLQTENQTNAGEMVLIEGLSIFVLGQTDAQLLKVADQSISVEIQTNGTTSYICGIPSMIPACGGLFGNSEALSGAPSLPDQVSRSFGIISNGIPHASNFMPLSEPMLWSSAGKGDSTFNVKLQAQYQTATNAQFGSVARSAIADYVAPYTPPTSGQVFIDFMVVLVGCTVNPLSTN